MKILIKIYTDGHPGLLVAQGRSPLPSIRARPAAAAGKSGIKCGWKRCSFKMNWYTNAGFVSALEGAQLKIVGCINRLDGAAL